MDTKTRKSEAMALLAKIDPADRDYLGQDKLCFHLNLWTAERAGYTIKDAIGGWEVAEPDDDRLEFVSFLTDAIPSYTHDVDACLTLKLPDRCIWKLYHGDDRGASATVVFRPAGQPALDWGFGRAKSLPVAMLKAWWVAQD